MLTAEEYARLPRGGRSAAREVGRLLVPHRAPLGGEPELTSYQVALALGCSARTASKWIDRGRIPGRRLPDSGDRRVRVSSLLAFARDNGFQMTPALRALRPDVVGATGLAAGDADHLENALPAGLTLARASPLRLGTLAAGGGLRGVVVGPCEFSPAGQAAAAKLLRDLLPAAVLVAVFAEDAAGGPVYGGPFDHTARLPADWAAVAGWVGA